MKRTPEQVAAANMAWLRGLMARLAAPSHYRMPTSFERAHNFAHGLFEYGESWA